MAKFRVHGRVIGSVYMGEYEADTPEEAKQKADDAFSVSLCHQCSSSCEDPVAEAVEAEEVAD